MGRSARFGEGKGKGPDAPPGSEALFAMYSVWWWEVFETHRRLFLTGWLLFLQGEVVQIVLAMLMELVALDLSRTYRPYIIDWCNDVNLMAHWALLFVYFFALLQKVDATQLKQLVQQFNQMQNKTATFVCKS